jgi:hypothetical protein
MAIRFPPVSGPDNLLRLATVGVAVSVLLVAVAV